jgi:uncharacterized protein YgiM (DUF1202 family)
MRKALLTLLGIIIFLGRILYAAEEFPFLGEVTAQNVNVRAGADISFERIHKLNKGRKIVVVGKQYDWYKIRLPRRAICYISSDYVARDDSDLGTVIGNNVNLRAKANQNSTILGQLDKGEKVKILERIKDWYKIQVPKNCFGWMHARFVSIYSPAKEPSKITEEESVQSTNDEVLASATEIDAPSSVEQTASKADKQIEQTNKYEFQARGIIKPIFCIFDCSGTHKLVSTGGDIICILQGSRARLRELSGIEVEVLGEIIDETDEGLTIVQPKELNILK